MIDALASDPVLLGLVLAPGPKGRCDDLRVGGAIVDHDPVCDIWRMWYYCRDETMGGPPTLGSGRVAMATSADGVKWDRFDGPGTRGAVFEPSETHGDFDTLHIGLTDITRSAGGWLMWYFGGNDELRTSTKAGIGTAAGLGMRPGLAFSTDGVYWHRVRGNMPNGALIDYSENELYAAWPNTVHDGRRFIMQITAPTVDMHAFPTTVFTSFNGRDWKALGELKWADGPRPWNISGLVTRQILANPIPGGRRWLMIYTGLDKDQARSIALADSDDALVWHHVSDGPIFSAGAPGSWDALGVAANRLVAVGDQLYLYYYGFQSLSGGGLRGIGLATAPIDNIAAFRRHQT